MSMSKVVLGFQAEYGEHSGVSASVIAAIFRELNISPPDDYAEFFLRSNGAEGPVGAEGYLALWPITELKQRNEAYHVSEFAPSLLLFGSDGGDTAFAFDVRSPKIVAVPFIGMADETTEAIGGSLDDLFAFIGES